MNEFFAARVQAYEHAYRRYLAALLEGDIRGISAIIEDLMEQQVSMFDIYRDFLQRGMYEIGKLWEQNRIPVSVEHLAASAVQVVLARFFSVDVLPPQHGPLVVVACIQNDFHDVGAMMIANVCESAGWRTLLLGANTPTQDMLRFIAEKDPLPDLLALSVTLPANRTVLEQTLERLTGMFPQLRIVIGGQALAGEDPASRDEAAAFREHLTERFASVRYLPTLEALSDYLRQRSSPASIPSSASQPG